MVEFSFLLFEFEVFGNRPCSSYLCTKNKLEKIIKQNQKGRVITDGNFDDVLGEEDSLYFVISIFN